MRSRVSLRLPVALRIADWSAVLTMLDDANLPDRENTANLRFLRDELRSFAAGMQALDRGDLAAAQTGAVQMDAGLWRETQDALAAKAQANSDQGKVTPPAALTRAQTGPRLSSSAAAPPPTAPLDPDADSAPLVSTLSIASQELRAGVLLLQGKVDPAKKLYAEAIAAEKKLGYHEPPFYIRPVAETEAEALLRAKDYADARTAYETALLERPASGFELYGIARADELAGHTDQSRTEYEAFLKAWPSADSQLPEMLHARAALASSGTTTTAAK